MLLPVSSLLLNITFVSSNDSWGYGYGVQRHFQKDSRISWRSVSLVEETGVELTTLMVIDTDTILYDKVCQ